MLINCEQDENAPLPTLVIPGVITTLVSRPQERKALEPMLTRLGGKVTSERAVHRENAELPMLSKPFPRLIAARFVHEENALAPRFVIESAMVRLVMTNLFAKAELPMLVTGRPLIAGGIRTGLVDPEYPVIVIAPKLVI